MIQQDETWPMWVAGREGATTNPFLLNVAFYKLEKIRRAKGRV
jgi:hypothetical protein